MKQYYNENIISDLIKYDFLVYSNNLSEWLEIVKPILENEEFQKRKLFIHHEEESLFDHSVLVSFKAFLLAKKFKADVKNCAIAGLLHDFYTEAWQYSEKLELLEEKYRRAFLPGYKSPSFFKKHGFTHPNVALINSNIYFNKIINKRIEDAIVKHMFPLSLFTKYKIPKYKESWIVTLADKIVSFNNFPKIQELPKYCGLVKRKLKKL